MLQNRAKKQNGNSSDITMTFKQLLKMLLFTFAFNMVYVLII